MSPYSVMKHHFGCQVALRNLEALIAGNSGDREPAVLKGQPSEEDLVLRIRRDWGITLGPKKERRYRLN